MKNRSRARVRRGYLAAAAVLALGLAAALNLLVSREELEKLLQTE